MIRIIRILGIFLVALCADDRTQSPSQTAGLLIAP